MSRYKLPQGTTIQMRFCLVNYAGVIVKDFNGIDELNAYLESIQPYLPERDLFTKNEGDESEK